MRRNDFKWAGISPFFHHTIVFNFIPHDLMGKTIVEGGCGKGIYGFLLRTTRDLKKANLIGLDISKEYLDESKKYRIYDKYIVASLDKMPFPDKSVDLYLAVEVFTHLTKDKGKLALLEADRICKGRTVIVIPNNIKHKQPEYYKSDSHHATWSAEELKAFGYKVYGFGLRLPTPDGDFQSKVYYAFQYIFTPITYFLPQLGAHLIAVKDY